MKQVYSHFFLFLSIGVLAIASCHSPTEAGQEINFKNKYADSTLRTIRETGDRRNGSGLLPYLLSDNPVHQLEAVLCLASFSDSIHIDPLTQLLNHKEKKIRQAAAFALGQTGEDEIGLLLYDQLSKESLVDVKATLMEAIGKSAPEIYVDSLLNLPTEHQKEKEGQIMGLYRFGMRGMGKGRGLDLCFEYLDSDHESLRLASSAYLSRHQHPDSVIPYRILISHLLKEPSVDVRLNLIRSLSGSVATEVYEFLASILNTETNPLVKVNAIRSLANYSTPEAVDLLRGVLLQDSTSQVQVAAASHFLNHGKPSNADQYWIWASNLHNYRARAILKEATLKFADDHTLYSNKVKEEYISSGNAYEKSMLLKALTYDKKHLFFVESEVFNTPIPVIRSMGMEGLLNALTNNTVNEDPIDHEIMTFIQRGLSSGDVALVSLTAGFIRNSKLSWFSEKPALEMMLLQAEKKLVLPREVEAQVEIYKTLSALKEKDISPPKVPRNLIVNWKEIAKIDPQQQVLIKTIKGDIVLELNVEEAPVSVWNFLNLIKTHFYTRQYIHRVVPNFVIQDGCPRGDGYGGPDHLIRSEFTSTIYETGSLGMASAGPDTESSQWFITHSPTPHLEGRYTHFGKVISGMDIIHHLEVSDAILSYEVLNY